MLDLWTHRRRVRRSYFNVGLALEAHFALLNEIDGVSGLHSMAPPIDLKLGGLRLLVSHSLIHLAEVSEKPIPITLFEQRIDSLHHC